MCGSTKAPKVVKQDPVADQKAADARATQQSNADTALRRRQAAQNSLLTIGPAGTDKLKNTPRTLLGSVYQGAWAAPVNPRKRPGFDSMVAGAFGNFDGIRKDTLG